MECQDIVEVTEIERVFSQHFPFPNMGSTYRDKIENKLIYTNIYSDSVTLMLQDPEIWDNAKPMSLPVDIFNGKSFRNIWISLKVDHVDADAFLSSHETVEELYLSGPGWVDGVMPLRM